jgi:hypothetical protein
MPRAKANTAVPDPQRVLLAEVSAQDEARRLRNFTVLGRAYTMSTPKGVIHFEKKKGPGIAQETVSGGPGPRLLMVGSWPELPDIKQYSEKFCQACLADCSACQGKGTAGCLFMGCGGNGKVKAGEKECPNCVAAVGYAVAACPICSGYGAIAVMADCPCCHGNKVADCGACKGTGKRPTGFAGGAREGALCTSCRGSMRDGKWKKQDLAHFVVGKLGNYLFIGPVIAISAEPIEPPSTRFGSRFDMEQPADGASREMIRLEVPPDEQGMPLMLVLPMNNGRITVPCPAYFVGGAKFA